MISPPIRELFDALFDAVCAALPDAARALLENVPVHVDDEPSAEVLRSMGLSRPESLCGLYTGIPLSERSVQQFGHLSDVIHLYRRGILTAATDRGGRIDEDELRRQIRITLLHELGHHHGLGESRLRELGY